MWIEKKKKSWSVFLEWLRQHGISTAGIGNPGGSGDGSGNAGASGDFRGALAAAAATQRAIPFASGGKVPGVYLGRADTCSRASRPARR